MSIDNCTKCPGGYLCDVEGMYDFDTQKKICLVSMFVKRGLIIII